MDPFIVYCLELIQQTDIYKAESAELKNRFIDYRKVMKKTKANECKYFKYDPSYPIAENKCCSISDYSKYCRLLLDGECGAFKERRK